MEDCKSVKKKEETLMKCRMKCEEGRRVDLKKGKAFRFPLLQILWRCFLLESVSTK